MMAGEHFAQPVFAFGNIAEFIAHHACGAYHLVIFIKCNQNTLAATAQEPLFKALTYKIFLRPVSEIRPFAVQILGDSLKVLRNISKAGDLYGISAGGRGVLSHGKTVLNNQGEPICGFPL